MNLEQIKDTQESLNQYLSKILEEVSTVVNFIAGNELTNQPINPEGTEKDTNGILDRITYSQQQNRDMLDKLNSQISRLCNSTWQREIEVGNCKMSN